MTNEKSDIIHYVYTDFLIGFISVSLMRDPVNSATLAIKTIEHNCGYEKVNRSAGGVFAPLPHPFPYNCVTSERSTLCVLVTI
jgi:hypothetical protein